MDIEELLALADPFLRIALPAFVFIWFVLRPLSRVYRIREDHLEVFTFFVSKVASVNLAEVTRLQLMERRALGSLQGRRIRWLTAKLLFPPPRVLIVQTEQETYALPAWLDAYLASRDPGEALAESKQDLRSGLRLRLADSVEKGAAKGVLFAKQNFPRMKTLCLRGSRSAAIALVILPLWLTCMDWIGIGFLSEVYTLPSSLLFRDERTILHLSASAFVFLYGIMSLGILISGHRIPFTFAALGILAGLSRFIVRPPFSHDISHMLFDSCSGYSAVLDGIGVTSLVATGIIAAASWVTRPSQARGSAFEAATP